MGITHNTSEIAARMRRRGNRAEPELKRAAVQGAKELQERSVAIMTREIYDIPEKRGKDGRPLWIRIGELRAFEAFFAQGVHIRHSNQAPHALSRYRYGKPGGRPARPPQRASSWYVTAIRQLFGRTTQLRREAVRRAMRDAGEGK